MALANYSDLTASVADWLHRTDLTALIPDLVTLCETVINYGDADMGIDGLRAWQQETIWTSASSVPASCTAGSATVTLPSDCLDMRQLSLYNGSQRIELIDISANPLTQAEQAQITGTPKTYYIVGNTINFTVIPSSNFDLRGLYYAKVGPLETQSTNWLMTSFPNVYLFGTCMMAAPWLGTDNRIGIWANGFKAGLMQVRRSDNRRRFKNIVARTEIQAAMNNYPYNILDASQ